MKALLRHLLPAVACAGLLLSPAARADVSAPFLAEDVNVQRDVDPRRDLEVVELASTTLLFAVGPDAPGQDEHLWRSDRTADGTRPVPIPVEAVEDVAAVTSDRDGVFFFAAPAGQPGVEALYFTDGTTAGTERLTLDDGLDDVVATILDPSSDRLFFVRREIGVLGRELWVSDGTPGGTRFVSDLNGARETDFHAVVGSDLYYVSIEEAGGPWILYRRDLVTGETLRIKPSVDRTVRTVLGDRLVFFNYTNRGEGATGFWATDGTLAGTVLLSGAPGLVARTLTRSGDRAYFAATRQRPVEHLFVTDGTPVGTRLLASIDPPFDVNLPVRPLAELQPFGERSLLFAGYREAQGVEPWASDATPDGTGLLADVFPGETGSDPSDFGRSDAFAYFTATDPQVGRALYGTDGEQVRRLSGPGRACGPGTPVGWINNDFYYFGETGNGRELCRVTGLGDPVRLSSLFLEEPFPPDTNVFTTFRGLYFTAVLGGGAQVVFVDRETGRLTPLLPSPALSSPRSSSPSGLISRRGDLFFVGVDPMGDRVLYRKTGDERSVPLDTLREEPFSRPDRDLGHEILAAGGRLFVFLAPTGVPDDPWFALWSSDGTVGGARLLADGIAARDAWAAGGRVFFTNEGADGLDLWVSDGTEPGTRVLRRSVEPGLAAPFGNRLLFTDDGDLWTTDGTDAGTRRWLDLGALGLSAVDDLFPIGDRVYFLARQGAVDRVFLSDGTAAGTVAVTPPDQDADAVAALLGDRVIYNDGGELWAAGPAPGQAVRLNLPAAQSGDDKTAVLDGDLWLVAADGSVVRTDGTPQGSAVVAAAPSANARFESVFAVPGHLLFVNRENELFSTGGMGGPNGTLRLLRDFSGFGRRVAVVGSRAYFGAADEIRTLEEGNNSVGFELWAVETDGTAPPPPPPGDLQPPSNVRATGTEDGIVVSWDAVPDEATRVVVEAMGHRIGEVFEPVAAVDADRRSVLLADVDFDPLLLRVRSENADEVSPWSPVVPGTRVPPVGGVCDPRIALCLQDDRFQVEVRWRDRPSGTDGRGDPAPFDFSDDSGAFTFFDQANVELVVKTLDARTVNGNFWNFYGALSDVEYWVTVTDLQARTTVTYYNPEDEICGQADTSAFPRLLAPSPLSASWRASRPVTGVTGNPNDLADRGITGCVPDAERLCLTDDRFRVSVTWRDQRSGDTGVGRAIPGTLDSGYFWFFDPENVELAVKVLDARAVNGFHWVFYGALTDVEYTLTVTDTETGETKQYFNPPGNICGGADTRAF